MEVDKCCHVIIEEIEMQASWNSRERVSFMRTEPNKGADPDYSWLADHYRGDNDKDCVSASQAVYLHSLTAKLRIEETDSLIMSFRYSNRIDYKVEQLVSLMASIIVDYLDEQQRIQLIRKKHRKSAAISGLFFQRLQINRVTPQPINNSPNLTLDHVRDDSSIFAVSSVVRE